MGLGADLGFFFFGWVGFFGFVDWAELGLLQGCCVNGTGSDKRSYGMGF